MYFLNPGFLWASGLVLIPLIIHLIRFFRIRPVPFPDIQLLREIQEEKKSVRRIIYWLILLFRTLLILFLVLAFSLPYKKNHSSVQAENPTNLHVFFIDNSLSMMNENSGGVLLAQAIKWADKMMQKLPPSSSVYVCDATGSFLSPAPCSMKKAEEILRSIQFKNNTLPVEECLVLLHNRLRSENQEAKIYVFSDFQRATYSPMVRDSFPFFRQMYMYPLLPGILQNASVDTAWLSSLFAREGMKTELVVKIRNHQNKPLENVLVRWYVDEKETGVQTGSMAPSSDREFRFSWNASGSGFHPARVELEDNGLPFDNQLYLNLHVGGKIHISVIHGFVNPDTSLIPSVFRTDSIFSVYSVSDKQVVWNRVQESDMVILNEIQELTPGASDILAKMNEEGKTIVYIPPAEKISSSAFLQFANKMFLSAQPDTFAKTPAVPGKKSIFFEGVFENEKKDWKMPECRMHYKVRSGIFPVWAFSDGSVFVGKLITNRSGNYYFFSCPLQTRVNGFMKHPSVVPFFLNMAFSSVRVQPLYYLPLKNQAVVLPDVQEDAQIAEVRKIPARANDATIWTEIVREMGTNKIYPFRFIKDAGFYEVLINKKRVMEFSLNRMKEESGMSFHDRQSFMEHFPRLSKNRFFWNEALKDGKVSEASVFRDWDDIPLWKPLIVCAIFCIFMEILLQVFFKKYT
jgi:hypothetical protein